MYQKIYASKTCCQEQHVDLLLIGKEKQENMFLSNILIFHV